MAILCGGEGGEFGIGVGKLGKDFFFVGVSHRDVVEVAVKLVHHLVLAGDGGGSEKRILGRLDAVDDSGGISGAEDIASCVGV